MNDEILLIVKERGLLLEKSVIELLNNFRNNGLAKEFLLNIEKISGQKMITMNLLNKNLEFVNSVVKKLSGEEKELIENTFVKLGFSLEVRREREVIEKGEVEKTNTFLNYKIFYADTRPNKKIEVRDFIGYLRSRYQTLQRILMSRHELQNNLVSIGKISNDRQSLSIIGLVTEKRITKNRNLIIRFEDLTGEINALIKTDNSEVFSKGEELQLDDVVGVKGSGNKDLIFVHDIYFPDAFLLEKTRFDEDVSIAFLSDIHCGSDRHLGKSFEKFLDWINEEDANKIRYLFITGDNVDGVGIFPNQEDFLSLKSMREQYQLLASYLKRIPKRIVMFMCPGQHDAVRVAEPQPVISKKYAPELYEIENLVLVTNPCLVKLIEGKKEFKVLMYHGASIHSFINNIKKLRELRAHRCPAMAVKHMLKRRHLAPTHGEITYIPYSDSDPLIIKEVPDIICIGEVHKPDVENYNGVLIITGSCWQAKTPYEEKVGNEPSPAKVPVFNLKSGALKIYDFSDKAELEKWE